MTADDNRGWRAYIEPDFPRRGVAVHIGRSFPDGGGQVVNFPLPVIEPVEADHFGTRMDTVPLRLDEDQARALYEALADHFGHSVHDVRAIRRDYDHERKRTDKLTDTLIGLVNRG